MLDAGQLEMMKHRREWCLANGHDPGTRAGKDAYNNRNADGTQKRKKEDRLVCIRVFGWDENGALKLFCSETGVKVRDRFEKQNDMVFLAMTEGGLLNPFGEICEPIGLPSK